MPFKLKRLFCLSLPKVSGTTGLRHYAKLIFLFLVETGFHHIGQAGFKLLTCLRWSSHLGLPKCWDYKHKPPCPVLLIAAWYFLPLNTEQSMDINSEWISKLHPQLMLFEYCEHCLICLLPSQLPHLPAAYQASWKTSPSCEEQWQKGCEELRGKLPSELAGWSAPSVSAKNQEREHRPPGLSLWRRKGINEH